MIKHFIFHKWKESVRSTIFQKNLVVNIFLGLFVLYMLVSFAFLGFFVDVIIKETFPSQNTIAVFNGFLLYYFGMELIMRLQLQELPVLSVQPYLHLPISRKSIVHYLLSQNLLSIFNYFPLLVLIPFAFKAVLPEYGIFSSIMWLGSAILFSLFLNYLCTFIKRQVAENFWLVPATLGLLALIAFLDYQKIIGLNAISASIFNYAITSFIPLLIILTLLIFTYYLNYKVVISNTYLDEIGKKSKIQTNTGSYAFLDRFGQVGQLIGLEVKLIFRNKRSKSVALTSLIFIFYGLIFYTNEIYMEGNYMLIFAGVFITGMFIMNYGQFIPSWESSYFDRILSSNISTETYLLSKYYLVVPTSIAAFILSTPYAYFGWKVVAINFVMMLFNIGVNVFLILFFSTFNDRRIDLSKGSMLNWEGVGASQFIMIIPTLLFPMVLFLPFDYFLSPTIGYAFLGAVGILGLFLHKYLIALIAKRFERQKYKIAVGFRKE